MEKPKKYLLSAFISLAVLYGAAWLTLRDVPAPYVEWEIPTHPFAKAAYDYAHAIKLPDSMPQPVSFKFCKNEFLGLCLEKAKAEEYWEHLCKTEATEQVYRVAKDVRGLVLLTPLWGQTDNKTDRHKIEDAGLMAFGGIGHMPVVHELVNRRRLFESYDQPFRYSDDRVDFRRFTYNWETDTDPTSISPKLIEKHITNSDQRYGYITRGFRRERDREFRISGAETIVIDRQDNEVLGVQRAFSIAPPHRYIPGAVIWESARSCPNFFKYPAQLFLKKVLLSTSSEPIK